MILIVMHSNNTVYGAGRSLAGWLKNSGIKVDLLCPRTVETIDNSVIKNTLGENLGKIYYEWLPFDRCYLGKNRVSSMGFLYQILNNFMWKVNRRKIVKFMNRYDKVYLNSLVLWPLIADGSNIYIHIREIFDGSDHLYKKVVCRLNSAKGCIFIDQPTYDRFKDQVHTKKTVLINPFDMRDVSKISREQVQKELGISRDKPIFAVIGMIYETKGVKFIIEAFIKAEIDAYLLVVGKIKGKYANECVAMSRMNDSVIFPGEIQDIEKIYAVSDHIIRGEKCFCIGRTTYEGLFAGTDVIVPGIESDIQYFQGAEKYRCKIHFYPPGDQAGLTEQFRQLNDIRNLERSFDSNIDEYVAEIKEFMEIEK